MKGLHALCIVALLAAVPALASASCSGNCNGNGVCENDACLCFSGYGGPACDVVTKGCPLGCSGHGKCADGVCDCDIGFRGAACDQVSMACDAVYNCTGHGRCVAGKCVCDAAWSGSSCDVYQGFQCPDALANCTDHGVCVLSASDAWMCKCDVGFCGDKCHVVCARTPGCPNNCSGQGSCTQGACNCAPGFNEDDCSVVVETPGCPSYCSGRGLCLNGACECESGWLGSACDVSADPGATVTHGTCSKGKCTCHPGWYGVLCDKPSVCPSNCSAQGSCVAGKCICYNGFTGPDCSLMCPTGLTMFGCADRGACVLSNSTDAAGEAQLVPTCFCDDGYSGTACEVEDEDVGLLADSAGSPIGIALLAFMAVVMVIVFGGYFYNKSLGKTGIAALPGGEFVQKQVSAPPQEPGYHAM